MPVRPKVPCSHPGCPTLIEANTGGRCTVHVIDRRPLDRDYARRRIDTEEQKFYSSARWKKFRNVYAQRHPWCEECDRQGRFTPMKLVDHIVAIKDGGARLS